MSARRALIGILLVGLLVHLPSLASGFFIDDYVHQAVFRNPELLPTLKRWSLFDFGQASDWTWDADSFGAMPWWTSTDWKARFFRPLASLSLSADHMLFGDWALGYHLMSLALHLCLLSCAYPLYRRLGFEPRAAQFTLLILALSPSTAMPVGWVANRSTVMATLFTVLTVLAALGHARRPSMLRLFATFLAAAAAVLSKESGIVSLFLAAFVFATHSKSRANGTRLRWAALLAFALALFYVVGYAGAGFGTRSLFYATPWSEPLSWLRRVFVLFSLGGVGMAVPIPIDPIAGVGQASTAAWLVLPVLVALGVWGARRWRSSPHAGLLLIWTALALAAPAGTAPSVRLLMGAMVPAAALIAILVSAARQSGRSRLERRAGTLLALSATLGSGVVLLLTSASLPTLSKALVNACLSIEVGSGEPEGRTVLVLQQPGAVAGMSLASTWMIERGELEHRLRLLQHGGRGLKWTRVGERSFKLESLDEALLSSPFEELYLSERPELTVGTRWVTPDFTVEATRVDDGHLMEIRIELTRSLDHEALVFLAGKQGGYRRVYPPAIGQSLILERPPPLVPFVP